ncbi:MAG: S41 family peptidase, partial [Bryobacteraceae bacterium]
MSSHFKILALVCICAGLPLAAAPPVLAPPSPPKPHVKPAPSADPAAGLAPLLEKFVQVMTAVKSNAAEPSSTDKMIYQGAIPSMLRQLDPHTQFFNPVQFAQLQQMEDSEQKGFGSIVSVLPGQVIFLQTLPGTPSNKAGIQPGDNLVGIGNIAIGRLEPKQIVQLLTAARQQKITVFIRRQGAKHI